jgi:hypothetical protein
MRILLAICVCVVAFGLFFTFVPVISSGPPVCTMRGAPPTGYDSLSFHLFNVGEAYYSGQFYWLTHGPSVCY